MTPFLHGGMAFRAAEMGFLCGGNWFRATDGWFLHGESVFRAAGMASSTEEMTFGWPMGARAVEGKGLAGR
jgi:hypothetical protein